jgi:hypothetical protein
VIGSIRFSPDHYVTLIKNACRADLVRCRRSIERCAYYLPNWCTHAVCCRRAPRCTGANGTNRNNVLG